MNGVVVYRFGVVCCSVCAPQTVALDDVRLAVNMSHPTGIESRWEFSKDPTFAGGEPNPCPCNMDTRRIHYLMNC